MADVQGDAKERLTLWVALKDLGWLPVLLMGLGGLSIIDILEQAVLHDLSLITPFQIVLNGYRRITDLIGAIVEPLFQPTIDWFNAHLDWRLHLHPVWRSLFVLGNVLVMGMVRAEWRSGAWASSILYSIMMCAGVLSGSLAVGLLPLAGGWWVQGLLAAAPLALLWFARECGSAMLAFFQRDKYRRVLGSSAGGAAGRYLVDAIRVGAASGALAFVLGAGLSFVPGLHNSAGVLVLGGIIAATGALALVAGLSDTRTGQNDGAFADWEAWEREHNRNVSRLGLSVLGGFVAAGLILLSNWAVTALG